MSKIKYYPGPIWSACLQRASDRIAHGIGWNKVRDTVSQLAEEIVAAGEGEKFLKAARRGRPSVKSLRGAVTHAVESLVTVKRRAPRIRARPLDSTEGLPGIG